MRVVLPILASFVLIGCSAKSTAPFTEHDPRIVGTWYITDFVSLERSHFYETSYFEVTYFPDGQVCAFEFENNSTGTHMSLFTATWKIENGKLINTPVKSTDPDIKIGVPVADEIESVTPSVMILRATEGGPPYNNYRYPEDRGDKLCHLRDLSKTPVLN